MDLSRISRRRLLQTVALATVSTSRRTSPPVKPAGQQYNTPAGAQALPPFTGPSRNLFWNSVGPFVEYPQKAPLILLTDRPPQLETPRHYFQIPFTPNEAFYVRWHLDEIPNSVDLSTWRLRIEDTVQHPVSFTLDDLLKRFKPVSVTAVNQCSGNSRSKVFPRVPGGQWGNGAMGNAKWTGVRLRELLDFAKPKPEALAVQFQGLDRGKGPEQHGSHEFLKSFELKDSIVDECIVAYAMNDAPLPMLNGFPVRLVVPGYFATYWVKSLTSIRLLARPDENFWMKTGYRIPDTPNGSTTPEDVKSGKVKTIPINRMPVRSFIITPSDDIKLVAGLPATIRGIAFSGHGSIQKVNVSFDDGRTWSDARLGEDFGPYSFRTWLLNWTPHSPGRYMICSRATDTKGNSQPDQPVWNPGGYLWNTIERQQVTVGPAA
jgi:DMSO/TMAO reductase YedYZ molybdopterin-dependent catalytic subunit